MVAQCRLIQAAIVEDELAVDGGHQRRRVGQHHTVALRSLVDAAGLFQRYGGLFVLLIPNAINHALLYLLAIVAGSLLTGVVYAVIKKGEAVELVTVGEKV